MHRAPTYFSDTLPGKGRRPRLDVTLHAEDDTLVLAVSSDNGDPAVKHPPSPQLGDWEAFAEVDGARAGWMTTVRGRGVATVLEALGDRHVSN